MFFSSSSSTDFEVIKGHETRQVSIGSIAVMGKIVFLKIVFYFKIENTILFSIFKYFWKVGYFENRKK